MKKNKDALVKKKKVLGIDPGLASLGYGVVEVSGRRTRVIEYGCLQTKAGVALNKRIAALFEEIDRLIVLYEIDVMVLEQIFFSRNTKTAMLVAKVYGALLILSAQKNLDLYEYTPLQIKQAVAAYGRADKLQVQSMVQRLLGLKDKPVSNHAADALAAALCYINSRGLSS